MQPNRIGFRPIMSDPLPYNGDNIEAANRYELRMLMSETDGLLLVQITCQPMNSCCLRPARLQLSGERSPRYKQGISSGITDPNRIFKHCLVKRCLEEVLG